MASTHLCLHYHLVFSTKNRDRSIADSWKSRLHAYLGGCVATIGGVPLEVNGVEDHVHLLIGLKATHCLADVLREIKSASSKWVHDEIHNPAFHWQDGYGAFTVSASNLDEVRAYIRNQADHHRRMTFQEEYVAFLKRNGIKYDDRYLW